MEFGNQVSVRVAVVAAKPGISMAVKLQVVYLAPTPLLAPVVVEGEAAEEQVGIKVRMAPLEHLEEEEEEAARVLRMPLPPAAPADV